MYNTAAAGERVQGTFFSFLLVQPCRVSGPNRVPSGDRGSAPASQIAAQRDERGIGYLIYVYSRAILTCGSGAAAGYAKESGGNYTHAGCAPPRRGVMDTNRSLRSPKHQLFLFIIYYQLFIINYYLLS